MHVKAAAGRSLPTVLSCLSKGGRLQRKCAVSSWCVRAHSTRRHHVGMRIGEQNIPVGRVVAVRRAGTRSKSIQKYSGLEFQQASLGLSLRPSRSSSVRDTLV